MLFESIFFGFWAVNFVVIDCEAGQRLSNKNNQINDAINRIDWYLLPIEVQRILIVAIMHGQQPLHIKFFGSISCNREQFERVCALNQCFFRKDPD